MSSYFENRKNSLVLVFCFMYQLQYRNKNENFISNFAVQFIKKTKCHFRYTSLFFCGVNDMNCFTNILIDELPKVRFVASQWKIHHNLECTKHTIGNRIHS